MSKKSKSKFFKIIVFIGILFFFAGAYTIYKAYTIRYKPNVVLVDKKAIYFYINTGSSYTDVLEKLSSEKIIADPETFEWLSDYKNYKSNIKPGKYSITQGMNNNELINMLLSGRQEPVKLVFNNVRTKYQLAGKIAKQIEADSSQIIAVLNDAVLLKKYNLTTENVVGIFIPNTYEIYWNTSAKQLLERMNKEYQQFWSDSRKEKATIMKLSPVQVIILASIVQEETRKYDEMPKVAGLYLNRIHQGMKLEADPTVKFAIGDFTLKRVLNKHLEFESPYNTYKIKGLPPGPISLPDSRVIDKVLNYDKHNFIYMCAKEDFSGYHNFAKTYSEHLANARKYQNALNRLKIK